MLGTLTIERLDAMAIRQEPRRPRDVAVVIRALQGAQDVMVSLEPEESHRIQDARSLGEGLSVMAHNGDAQGQRQGDKA
jgi:hypothetical protein